MVDIKKLSVIVPCYNEEATLEAIIREVQAAPIGKTKKEIIIVDDCSTDSSKKIAQALTHEFNNISVIAQKKNCGKGAALKRGFLASTGDLVIVQDADRELDPRDYAPMLQLFREDRADVVIGSRFSGGAPRRVAYLANRIGNKFMTRLAALLSGVYVSDLHTCYIMFKGAWIRANAPSLKSKRFGFNPEIIARIAREKDTFRICETSVSYFARTKSEGKKIGAKDGLAAIRDIIRYNLFR